MGWQEKIIDRLFDIVQPFFKRRRLTSEALRDSTEINAITEKVIHSGLAIDCFFLMMTHNGGKKVIPHGFKYRSIVNGNYLDWLMPHFVITDYKNLELDHEYEMLLRKIKEENEVAFSVKDMENKSLKARFLSQNLKYVRFYFLYENEFGMWYMMAATVDNDEDLNSNKHQHAFYIATNKIKKIIKRY